VSSTAGDVAGFVLAGGQSSRMGSEKALVQLRGVPLIAHTLQILRDAGLDASIAGARSAELAKFAPIVADVTPDLGPLGGICAALAATSAPYAVFLSVDAPLIPAPLLTHMLAHAKQTSAAVTLVSLNGFAQTFPAVVDRRALPALEATLHSADRGCYAAFRAAAQALAAPLAVLSAEELPIAHPAGLVPELWFSNINAPADLAHIELLL
jgi:molybdenum cofactor guanylyltransferase